MSEHASPIAPHAALIMGCGYLGQAILPLLTARGLTVYGAVRSPQTAHSIAALGVRPLILDVTQRLTLAAMRRALEHDSLEVYYLIPPGRETPHHSPRKVVVDGLASVLAMFKSSRITAAVMASSTAVYGQSAGEKVDADTPPQPQDDRARLLLESESLFLAHAPQFRVCRLAGLYGPSRVIGLSAVREGSPIAGNPAALLNLIHVDDAAALLHTTAQSRSAARVELGCDNQPSPRLEYYRELARRIHAPEPTVLDDAAAKSLGLNVDRLRRSSSKYCDNTITCLRTGWAPKYPSFHTGLAASL